MIRGSHRHGEARIRLTTLNDRGEEREIAAVIDTGFNGSLTLPPSIIAALRLPWHSYGRAELANGAIDTFDVHVATVMWDGLPRRILVEAAETAALVGMSLLFGYDLHIQVIEGGDVTIQLLQTAA